MTDFRLRDAVPVDLTAAKILADSIGPHGSRLVTMEVTFPRPYLAEFNTHRMLSRNSASSRAIPTEKQIERVLNAPYIPTFNGRVKGMGVGEELTPGEQLKARNRWLDARDAAVQAALGLLEVDKSRANRLLEPFLWHTCIVSATEWDNFFGLRDHEAAQPEFRALARKMRKAMEGSAPMYLHPGMWHLPMVSAKERQQFKSGFEGSLLPSVSAGRCARVSYDTHWKDEAPLESRERWERLAKSGHWSPAEHPAMCVHDDGRTIGNFIGWKQLRKFYPEEAVFRG
jgi:hypothetical protein